MDTIDEDATRREMINWLRGQSKNEVVAVTLLVNRLNSKLQIPLYLSKEELLQSLLEVDRDVIWAAIDQIFPDEDPCGDVDEEDDDEDEIDADA